MLSIVLGRHDRNSDEGVIARPTRVEMHPKWNDKLLLFDFCLLEFSKDNLLEHTNGQHACLPPKGQQPPAGRQCYVAGWGKLGEQDRLTDKLQEIRLPILDTAKCNSDTSYKGFVRDDSMFCAGSMDGGRDACQGDSGGPFMCMNGDQPELTGLVSWGFGCARKNFPGVYGKISNVIDGWRRALVKEQLVRLMKLLTSQQPQKPPPQRQLLLPLLLLPRPQQLQQKPLLLQLL